MFITIEAISKKQKMTDRGEAISLGIKSKEYGDRWLNGWQNEISRNWKKGDKVEVIIEEKGQYLNFKALKPSVAPTPNYQSSQPKQDVNWDKISWGKCKHAFLVVLMEKGIDLGKAEKIAETWADASMRKLGQPEMKDFGQGDELDQMPFDDEFEVENIPF